MNEKTMTATQIVGPDHGDAWKVPASSGEFHVNSPAPYPASPRLWFSYRARRWRIYKRTTGGNWFLTFWHRGRRYNESLLNTAQKTAIATAKLKIDLVLDGFDQETRDLLARTRQRGKVAAPCSTVGELLAVHERASLGLETATASDYRNVLIRFLERLENGPAERLPLTVLNPSLVQRYAAGVESDAGKQPNSLASARIRRGGQRVLHKVQCCFSVSARNTYTTAGLHVPDLAPFFAALRAAMSSLLKHAKAFEGPPADASIQSMLDQWPQLPRNEFLAVGLALACGLRKGEISRAKWAWLGSKGGVPWLLAEDVRVKNRTGRISLRPLDPFWRSLNDRISKENWRGLPDDYVLCGTQSERTDHVFRRVAAWLHGLGWRTFFGLHALRAYAGGQVWLKWSPAQASAWLRHSSLQVTQDHYTYLQNEKELFQLERIINIDWAK